MQLTNNIKDEIDAMSYVEMLDKWRHAPVGYPLFQGEAGKYFAKRIWAERDRIGNAAHVAASKKVGWAGKPTHR